MHSATIVTQIAPERHASTRKLSLLDLTRSIVERSDRQALSEFHERRSIFIDSRQEWVCLSDYLSLLRERALKNGGSSGLSDEEVEEAHDMALEKFFNLPDPISDSAKKPRNGNTDCRRYLGAYLRHVEKELRRGHSLTPLQEEMLAGSALQKLVWRHFQFSLLEAKRRANPFMSRYFWKVNGAKICLCLPRHMTGAERRAWLEENIDDPDPHRQDERERIQKIIDARLEMGSFFSLEEPGGQAALRAKCAEDQPVLFTEGPALEHLDQIVAQEKADNIERQRPAIRTLGIERLKAMVLRVFDDLMHGRYIDGEIAKEFGVSKASFSRCAGSQGSRDSTTAIPDLWANTAQVLSSFAPFVEAARKVGVLETVNAIAGC